MTNSRNIHPIFEQVISRTAREERLGQRGRVIWLYGLSGSGKSTLAVNLEKRLFTEGRVTKLLDGDNIRTGLNQDLGFSDEDRSENIRRIAETSKLFVEAGIVVINSFITPLRQQRALAREILGAEDFIEVFVRCSLETCAARDVKGLYKKAREGQLGQFTGKDSAFEEPEHADLTVSTEAVPMETSLDHLYEFVAQRIKI